MKAPSSASLVALAGLCGALVTFAGPAAAHSILVNPPPIGPDDSAKSGPCGCYFGAGPQDPTDDPSPSACPQDYQVTTLQAGTSLQIQWKETINHDGKFRVAFTSKPPEDATKADMDANVMADLVDENATAGATLKTTITVPNEPCELCTIQLRQLLTGAAQPYYYSCAAVKIVADQGTGGAGGATGTTSATGSGGASTGGSGAGATGQGGEQSTGAGKAEEPVPVAASCAIRSDLDGDRGASNVGLLLGAMALVGSVARRIRGRKRA